jgi:hypothetical protein
MSRKVSMRASITNKTSIFGIMGGLYNRKISGRSSMNRVTSRLEIPAGAKEGYQYMKMHNLLSRNPLGSGGVGKMFRLRAGGSSLGSRRTATENSENNLGEQQEANLPPAEEGTCGPDKHNAETCSLHGDCWDGKCQCTGAWCSVDPVDGICDGVLIYPPGGGGVQCVLAPATARATRAPAASAAATNKTETEL